MSDLKQPDPNQYVESVTTDRTSDTKILSQEEFENCLEILTLDSAIDSYAAQARRIEELEHERDHVKAQRDTCYALIAKIQDILGFAVPGHRSFDFDVLDSGVRRVVEERDAALERAERAESQLRQIKEALPGERALESHKLHPIDTYPLRAYAKVLEGTAEPQKTLPHAFVYTLGFGVNTFCGQCRERIEHSNHSAEPQKEGKP